MKNLRLVNLTPHPINILDYEDKILQTIEKSGLPLLRLIEEKVLVNTIFVLNGVDGINIYKKSYRECENLPDKVEGTFYIVSGLVASALKRDDLLVPNTVRDEDGKIIGCDSFSVITD